METENIINGIFDHVKTLNHHRRYVLGKNLKSKIVYGENGFGNMLKVKQSEKNNNDELKLVKGGFSSNLLCVTFTDDGIVSNMAEIVASTRKLEEFANKDFIIDISPKEAFVIFPDITFVITIEYLEKTTWKEFRDFLQEKNLIEKDIEGFSGDLVSIDQLRKKIKNNEMTDDQLKDLRKKLYGLGYAISKQIS